MEEKLPAGSMRYPALAAVPFTSLVVGSIWWQTRWQDRAQRLDEAAARALAGARP
jgi:hypothetical protein